MVRGWSPSKIVSGSPDLQPTWSLLLKIKKGMKFLKSSSLKLLSQYGCFESFPFRQKKLFSSARSALNFRCQCTQQKLQSICAVLTFDPQLRKNLNIFCKRQISIKLFYLYQRLQCREKYFFKIKFVFFFYLRLSASKENDLPVCIYFWYQTDSGVPNTSIYSAVSLASPYYNYL
jgi:hypothetical protein